MSQIAVQDSLAWIWADAGIHGKGYGQWREGKEHEEKIRDKKDIREENIIMIEKLE